MLNVNNRAGESWAYLFDLCVIELFEFLQATSILASDEVDSDTLSSETSATSDTMDVVFEVSGQVVVDDQGDLLNVNSTSEKISGDQHSAGTSTEFVEDDITLSLRDISVLRLKEKRKRKIINKMKLYELSDGDTYCWRDGEFSLAHLLGQPVDLSAGVTENDGLCDVQGVVEIAKSLELPLLTLDGDVELLDSFKSEFISLDQDLNGVVHELLGDFKGFWWHGSREETDLNAGWQEGENVVDLVLETSGEHFIGFVEDEDLDLVGAENLAAQHVIDSAGGSDDDVNSGLQLGNVISDASSTDARVAAGVEVVTKGDDDLCLLLKK